MGRQLNLERTEYAEEQMRESTVVREPQACQSASRAESKEAKEDEEGPAGCPKGVYCACSVRKVMARQSLGKVTLTLEETR